MDGLISMNWNEGLFDSLLFAGGTLFFLWVSRHALRNPRAHGFYRFFAWECMLALLVLNHHWWHEDMFGWRQQISWALLLVSFLMAIYAVFLLTRKGGHAGSERSELELLHFEKTERLVTDGIYRYIRHPMYAALLYLAWAIYLKNITLLTTALVAAASVLLWLTALRDEAECFAYFGAPYQDYRRQTKRFVPFVW